MAPQPSPATLRSLRHTRWRFDEAIKKTGDCHIWRGAKNSAKSNPDRPYGVKHSKVDETGRDTGERA